MKMRGSHRLNSLRGILMRRRSRNFFLQVTHIIKVTSGMTEDLGGYSWIIIFFLAGIRKECQSFYQVKHSIRRTWKSVGITLVDFLYCAWETAGSCILNFNFVLSIYTLFLKLKTNTCKNKLEFGKLIIEVVLFYAVKYLKLLVFLWHQ